MEIDQTNINSLWASLMIEELVRSGVEMFCLAPGLRCTPLTLAVARRDDLRVFQHTDERGLGYFAVGYARATGKPAVVITTSGTAVANLLPAVVEARLDHLPLICLVADRPPELRDIGANQAIDQVKIFGDHVVWFNDFPCPTTEIEPAFVLSTMDYAVHASSKGPVHVNCQFREPLAAVEDGVDYTTYTSLIASWTDRGQPYTRYLPYHVRHSLKSAKQLEKLLTGDNGGILERGLVVVGPGISDMARVCAGGLAWALKWPVLIDVAGSRKIEEEHLNIDRLLSDPTFTEKHIPQVVVHCGGRPVSKAYEAWLKKMPIDRVILLTEQDDRCDPSLRHTHVLQCRIDLAAVKLVQQEKSKPRDSAWLEAWQEASDQHEQRHTAMQELSEPNLARTVSSLLDQRHGLFLGNSMPVRDMDVFAHPEMEVYRVAANRGASGIDGTLSSAIGFAAGLQRPVTLVIGDLALLHDINALTLLAQAEFPVTVVVVNNDGGGIFSFLPVADDPAFEPYFGTPHGLSFAEAAAWAKLDYHAPASIHDFEKAYKAAQAAGRSCVIEVQTDRDENVIAHRDLLS